MVQFKLEGQAILRHPEYGMENRLLLDKIHDGKVESEGVVYELKYRDFPTVGENPYELTDEEAQIIAELKTSFRGSERLRRHVAFLFEKGGMYCCCNGNLLYHGCVPMNPDGSFAKVSLFGEAVGGKEYFDMADSRARNAFFSEKPKQDDLDFLWYLWCGRLSPLCGRNLKTFERAFIEDKTAWAEEKNPYYELYYQEEVCERILAEFGLFSRYSHIVNGHTPVRTGKGELPIRANGRLLVIDGGFCKEYHRTTGIAGYTLIFNSHGLRLKAHQPFESVDAALRDNKDIHSSSEIIETEKHRVLVDDTDSGEAIRERIADLYYLLKQREQHTGDTVRERMADFHFILKHREQRS